MAEKHNFNIIVRQAAFHLDNNNIETTPENITRYLIENKLISIKSYNTTMFQQIKKILKQ